MILRGGRFDPRARSATRGVVKGKERKKEKRKGKSENCFTIYYRMALL